MEPNDPVCAVKHFVLSKEILLLMGLNNYHLLVLEANTLIADAKTSLPDMDKKAALANLLHHVKHLYEVFEANYGGADSRTLNSGYGLASTLNAMEQFAEAKLLLDSLYESACVHGLNHPDTERIEGMLKAVVVAKPIN
jgi:hypothetical protein